MFELRYENDMARDQKEARDDIKAKSNKQGTLSVLTVCLFGFLQHVSIY